MVILKRECFEIFIVLSLVPSFFFLCFSLAFFVFGLFTCNFMLFIKLRVSAGISGYVWGVPGCVPVSAGVWVCADVHRCVRSYARVCTGVGGCGRVWAGVTCVWDEFSEFLPENRVPTSADFNTYPVRIFNLKYVKFKIQMQALSFRGLHKA